MMLIETLLLGLFICVSGKFISQTLNETKHPVHILNNPIKRAYGLEYVVYEKKLCVAADLYSYDFDCSINKSVDSLATLLGAKLHPIISYNEFGRPTVGGVEWYIDGKCVFTSSPKCRIIVVPTGEYIEHKNRFVSASGKDIDYDLLDSSGSNYKIIEVNEELYHKRCTEIKTSY